MTNPVVRFRRLSHSASKPDYQSLNASGLDMAADLSGSVTLEPMARAAIPTGLALEIPAGYEGQVRPRSGRAIAEGLTLINSPGTIDADFRGEVRILVINLGDKPIEILPGDRIAQLVICPIVRVEIIETGDLSESSRGEGGFGHTGR